MRKLTEEEHDLWTRYTQGVKEIPQTIAPTFIPRTRPQVQDISFSPVLDLHHMTIQQAYAAVNGHLELAYYLGHKKVQHITGKSGEISREYETWARLHPRVRKITKQNDGGSWSIRITKPNKSSQSM